MTPTLAQVLTFLSLILSIQSKVVPVYPCVWKDEVSGAQLDLQVFKSVVLSNYSSYPYHGNVTYSPCSNNINYNGQSYMVVTSNGEYIQPVAKWDNGVTVPTYDNFTESWHFFYDDTNIKCISNHSQQMSLHITWSLGDLNNINTMGPNITNFNGYSGSCSFSLNTETVLTYNDDCIVPFYAVNNNNHQPYISSHTNLSVFNSYIFDAKIGIHQHILYTPCNDAIQCDNNLAQAVLYDANQTNCTYLSLFAGYGPTYSHTSYRQYSYYSYWNYNQYYDYNANADTQTIEILYKNGENCTLSESESMPRRFYVYWQCNTLAKPYGNVQATADVICTETLSIDSIYACPNLQQCVYYDQDKMLNLTDLIGRYFFSQNPNNKSSWFYYSVCQNGLSNTMTLTNYINQPTTLYNKFSIMSGIYSGPPTPGDINTFSVSRISSRFDPKNDYTKYYYDSEINAWIFQYTNGNLCPQSSLFTVQWNCGQYSTHLVAYTDTPCAVTLVMNTQLC